VNLQNGLPKRMPWLDGFTRGQVTDGGLRTSASGGNLGLYNPTGLDFGNDVFPVHAAMINVFAFLSHRFLDIYFSYA
jgi:hypothetical protein